MKQQVILDTGPLVAFINSRDSFHDWALAQWASIKPPLLTCEAVISEACFLLRDRDKGVNSVLELLYREILTVPFRLAEHIAPVSALLKRYSNVPMSLADACLVRMAELRDSSSILTLDSDFRVYRKHKHKIIPLVTR